MPARNYVEDLGQGMTLEMVWIPGGRFMMGSPVSAQKLAAMYPAGSVASPAAFENELPSHEVEVKGFWISRYEITSDQYKRVARAAPKPAREQRDPQDRLLWLDADNFCRALSKMTNRKYRLPAEAEWEYACRAGSPGVFHFVEASPDMVNKHVWHQGNSEGRVRPVGSSHANAWGLFDMHGNVAEWTLSMYRPYPYQADDGRNEARAHGDRVVRGGSYRDPWQSTRATIRFPGMDRAGLRVVREPLSQE